MQNEPARSRTVPHVPASGPSFSVSASVCPPAVAAMANESLMQMAKDQHSNWGTTLECHVAGTTMYRIRDSHGDNTQIRISNALNLRAISIFESGMQSAITNLTYAAAAHGSLGYGRNRKTGPPVTLPRLHFAQSLDLGGSISVVDTVENLRGPPWIRLRETRAWLR